MKTVMFLKLTFLITLGTYMTTNASLIIQDIDPDLTDVKERLKNVEQQLADTLVEMADVKERLEHLETSEEQEAHVSKSTTACRDGWMAYKGSCYYFGTTAVTFAAAQIQCRSLGADLVSVETNQENNFLKGFMQSHGNTNIHYWLGITDVETEGIWKLSKNNTEATYFDWSTATEPKGKTIENCARFASEHQYSWGDVGCNIRERYLCEE